MNNAIAIIATAALVTTALRFLPFLLFLDDRTTPAPVERLGKLLPFAIMGMLVVYCLKGISFTQTSGWMPQAIGCAVVALLHIWKRSTLLSIGTGTVCYMLLVQFVFQ